MILLIVLAVLILIVAGVTLEAARDVEIRTRGINDLFSNIEFELAQIKKMIGEKRET